MVEVHSQQLKRRFKTPWCSLAACAHVFLSLTLLLLPLYFAYASHSFWLKVNVAFEQPNVTFSHDVVVALDTVVEGAAGPTALWASDPTSSLLDYDHDGLPDAMRLIATLTLRQGEGVVGATLVAGLGLLVQDHARFKSDSLLVLSGQTALASAALACDGDLVLAQRDSLNARGGLREPYASDPLFAPVAARAADPPSPDAWLPASLLQRYRQRNVTLDYRCQYPVWARSAAAGGAGAGDGTFTIDVTARVGKQPIACVAASAPAHQHDRLPHHARPPATAPLDQLPTHPRGDAQGRVDPVCGHAAARAASGAVGARRRVRGPAAGDRRVGGRCGHRPSRAEAARVLEQAPTVAGNWHDVRHVGWGVLDGEDVACVCAGCWQCWLTAGHSAGNCAVAAALSASAA